MSQTAPGKRSITPVRGALFGIVVPYAGFAVAWGILLALSTPEYHHVMYLELGLVCLAWSIAAIGGLTASVMAVRRNASLRGGMRALVALLQAPVAIAVVALLPFSIAALNAYQAGFAAYDAAVKSCGHPPVLAWGGWGAHITLPTDPDYDRLKYETKDFLELGPPAVYFCSAADAEAHGYPITS